MTGDYLAKVRQNSPLVHNITNYVVMNYTANALLSAGASPVMAHSIDEVADMAGIAGSLVLNIGTLEDAWIGSMIKAGQAANANRTPVILDPVGAGATVLRTNAAKDILNKVKVTVVRGNASEILALGDQAAATKGVDATHGVERAVETARNMADQLGCIVAITGPEDLVTDGEQAFKIQNGHVLMGRVTGTGCTATAIMGAFLATATSDPLNASAAALAYWGLCGQVAAQTATAPGSYMIALLDALYTVSPEQLSADAKIEKVTL